MGELFYLLVITRQANRIVEFGASHGISTIYLAGAIRDLGGDSVITTEILPAKAEATRKNLGDAGLADVVEILVGDARDTLRNLDQAVDILVLDGRNDLYIEILDLVEPRASHPVLWSSPISARMTLIFRPTSGTSRSDPAATTRSRCHSTLASS